MNLRILFTLLVLFFGNRLIAQFFEASGQSVFQKLINSDADIGDYDNDGDIDIIVMGLNTDTGDDVVTVLYQNDGDGNFTEIQNILNTEYRNGEVQFIDYNNDGALDILISGLTSEEAQTRIYRQDNGNFIEVDFQFDNTLINSRYAWGKLDRDKNDDFILTGCEDAIDEKTYMFRGNGNDDFELIENVFQAGIQGTVQLADLDNDGDNDVIITGASSELEIELGIYENLGNFDFELVASLEGFFNGTLELKDLDGNGLIDILKTGNIQDVETGQTSAATKIYINTGNFEFSEFSDFSFQAVGDFSNFKAADFTGNGLLDFLLIGRIPPFTSSSYYGALLLNSGNLSLSETNDTGIPNQSYYDIEVADFDMDGDLDLYVVNGQESDIYFNVTAIPNEIPNAPPILESIVVDDAVALSWEVGSDFTTSTAEFLSYNIYIGSSSGIGDIVHPQAEISTGQRTVVELGNNGYSLVYSLTDFEVGTYYWSVQSVDSQYAGSSFAPEQSFEIKSLGLDGIPDSGIIVLSNNVTDAVWQISSDTPLTNLYIYTIEGKLLGKHDLKGKKAVSIANNAFTKGAYIIKIHSDSKSQTFKTLKQ